MEGLYFYWLAWIGWVWTTFFMNKNNPLRLKWAIILLAVILAAPYTVDVFIFEMHLSALAIAFFIFLETRRKKTGSFLYLFLTSFIIMLAYTSFLMFELFDPIWVLFDRKIMLGAAGFYLAVLLHKERQDRILALISGFLQGDLLFSAILWKFNFPYAAASMGFMDLLFISLGLLLAWSVIESMIAVMSGSTINQVEGEEQKTS
ncbi:MULTISPECIES: hypothetical protein [Mesobacillus]|uniref:YphA family membrane protein n=1 Tax=Mesobacillus TaxID=2675231 RepID=UPI001780D5DD|nr:MULTISPECIES: hypothetical protein [Mesobacillus]MCM3571680.1 hypothetical protein [Mesobacillus subterraneus]UYZ20587.1 hypothetical protein FOF60_16125 [Mesobacillus jeotgali]